MAADEDRDIESTEGKKKKSPLLLIIILVVVLLGAAAAVYFLVLKKPAETVDQGMGGMGSPQTSQMPTPQNTSAEPGPMVSYAPFIVNLADPGGSRYLKVTLSVELSKDKNFTTEVEAKEPKIKDIIISILSSKTYDEISTSQGKVALKQEIIRRLNTIMSTGRIMDVYITEFMIQ